MAERRFYFWESYAKAFALLTDEEAGRFVKACCEYAFGGRDPDFSDSPKLEFAFGMICGQLAMSVDIGVRAAEGGKKGGRPPKKSTAKSTVKTTALNGAKSTAKSTVESSAESIVENDMNMKVNVGADASLGGSASAPDQDGGDSDEY